MAFRFEEHLARMDRRYYGSTRDGIETVVVAAGRTYATTALDLWDAITTPERLARWFLPISGDLRLGGRYQLEGNAGGTIEECVRPELIKVTWEFGGGKSWVTVRLVTQPDGTRLELEHEGPIVPGFSDVYGPGALGVGWDGGFFGLTIHLADPSIDKPVESDPSWPMSPEGKAFYGASAAAWGEAETAFGTPAEVARARAEATRAFYTGEGPGMAGTEGGASATE